MPKNYTPHYRPALDRYQASEDGKRHSKFSTLPPPGDPTGPEYLKARIAAAFVAGWDAGCKFQRMQRNSNHAKP